MPTPQLWKSLRSLADAWQRTASVTRFVGELPRNAVQRSAGLAGALQELHAGAGSLMSNPLLLWSALPGAASLMPRVNLDRLEEEHEAWFQAAGDVEAAHRATVAWIRAHLHGYPMLPAPQLVAGSPLTTREFTFRTIWQPGERGQQLHLQDVPSLGDVLHGDAAAARDVHERTRLLADAFQETPEWIALATAHEALDQNARAELAAARLEAKDRLRSSAVDAHEPTRALPRAAYREGVIREVIEGLTGAARTYAEAFESADGLVELAASQVFSQLVCYPVTTLPANDLDVTPGTPSRVHFTTSDAVLISVGTGSVAWIADPLVDDAVFVTSLSINFGPQEPLVQMSGNLLHGTGAAWR